MKKQNQYILFGSLLFIGLALIGVAFAGFGEVFFDKQQYRAGKLIEITHTDDSIFLPLGKCEQAVSETIFIQHVTDKKIYFQTDFFEVPNKVMLKLTQKYTRLLDPALFDGVETGYDVESRFLCADSGNDQQGNFIPPYHAISPTSTESIVVLEACQNECTESECSGTEFMECKLKPNGCREFVNKGESSQCVVEPECQENENKVCKGNKLFYQDSCGNLGKLIQECDYSCSDGVCIEKQEETCELPDKPCANAVPTDYCSWDTSACKVTESKETEGFSDGLSIAPTPFDEGNKKILISMGSILSLAGLTGIGFTASRKRRK